MGWRALDLSMVFVAGVAVGLLIALAARHGKLPTPGIQPEGGTE